jgi:hypothetical protein
LDAYIAFFSEHGASLPGDLSINQVTSRANDCASGGMPTNNPEYLDADQYGRAQGGWVCLMGPQPGVLDSQCAAPGTNRWRAGQTPRLPPLSYVVHGHLIGKSIGGNGSETRDGHCVNMTPQSATPNSQMGQQAERRAKRLTEESPEIPFWYLVAAGYDPANKNYMPIGVWVFIISPTGSEAPGPFLNEAGHIATVGSPS